MEHKNHSISFGSVNKLHKIILKKIYNIYTLTWKQKWWQNYSVAFVKVLNCPSDCCHWFHPEKSNSEIGELGAVSPFFHSVVKQWIFRMNSFYEWCQIMQRWHHSDSCLESVSTLRWLCKKNMPQVYPSIFFVPVICVGEKYKFGPRWHPSPLQLASPRRDFIWYFFTKPKKNRGKSQN